MQTLQHDVFMMGSSYSSVSHQSSHTTRLHLCVSRHLKQPQRDKECENAEYGFNKCSLFQVSQSSSVVSQKILTQHDTRGKDYKDKP